MNLYLTSIPVLIDDISQRIILRAYFLDDNTHQRGTFGEKSITFDEYLYGTTRLMTPPPILSRSRRILLDLILYIIAFILAVLFLVPDAESAEIWWKKPGEKYWQECVVISTSVGPVYRYIPDGAVIAVRDGDTLVILSEGER